MNRNFIVTSVGCRLNQFESDILRTRLMGYESSTVNNICIINTCTVTKRADAKSRAIVKKLIRQNPDSYIIVTGCYAHTNPDIFKNIPGVNLIVNNQDKMRIPDILKEKGIISNTYKQHKMYITDRTRPYIKIQDGCNLHCSYCKVRIARGKSRSENFDEIIETAKFLSNNDYPEIVITGVNIGDYKYQDKTLPDLLEALIKIKKLKRIRLTSIEPTDITEQLLQIIQHKKIAGYFHIPLQSGSDKILRLMNRPYTSEFYIEKIKKLKEHRLDAIIGTDVIVGFPFETEDDFAQTYNLLNEFDIFYLHIFRYSVRENTPAANFGNTVPEQEKLRRANILRNFREQKKINFFKQIVGKKFEVIVENKIINKKYINSTSDNYIPILLEIDEAYKFQRKIITVKIISFDGKYIYGKIAD